MSRRLFRITVLLMLAGVAAAASGCYKRVIRAEGLGSDTIDTYEPNSKGEPDALDESMWGKRPEKN